MKGVSCLRSPGPGRSGGAPSHSRPVSVPGHCGPVPLTTDTLCVHPGAGPPPTTQSSWEAPPLPNRWARAPFLQPAPPGGGHVLGDQEALGLHPRLAQGKKASHGRGHRGVNTHPGVPSGPKGQVWPSIAGGGTVGGRGGAGPSPEPQGTSRACQATHRGRQDPPQWRFPLWTDAGGVDSPRPRACRELTPSAHPSGPGQGLSHPTPAPVPPARSEVHPGRAPAHSWRPGLALAARPSRGDSGQRPSCQAQLQLRAHCPLPTCPQRCLGWKRTPGLAALGGTSGELLLLEACFPNCKTGQCVPDRLPSASTERVGAPRWLPALGLLCHPLPLPL